MKSTHGGGCVGCCLLAAAATTEGRMATTGDGGGVRICPESFPRKKSATWKVFAFSTSGVEHPGVRGGASHAFSAVPKSRELDPNSRGLGTAE